MSDSLDVFQKIVEDHNNDKVLINQLLELVECLYRDLQNDQATIKNLEQQIQYILKQETFSITSKYVSAKEECQKLQTEIGVLKNENDDLNFQLISKNQEMNNLFIEKEETLRNHYAGQLQEKDNLLKQKDKVLEMDRLKFEREQEQVYSEMQALEASTALQIDQVEAKARKQIADNSLKLKDTMDTCSILRKELMSVKEQFSAYKFESEQTISELRKKLKLERVKEAVSDCSTDVVAPDLKLDVWRENPPKTTDSIRRKIQVYRSTGKLINEKSKRNILPALAGLENRTISENTSLKKRRLYNPDYITRLNSEGLNENQ